MSYAPLLPRWSLRVLPFVVIAAAAAWVTSEAALRLVYGRYFFPPDAFVQPPAPFGLLVAAAVQDVAYRVGIGAVAVLIAVWIVADLRRRAPDRPPAA